MNTKRRWLFTCVAIQGAGLLLGILNPPGEVTLHGLLLVIGTAILLFPGIELAVPLNTRILPHQVLQAQRQNLIISLLQQSDSDTNHLHFQRRAADLFHNGMRLILPVQEISRHISRFDRLYEQGDVFGNGYLSEFPGCPLVPGV